ncbi:hypothetical protein, partial [Salibacterium qingdaonense]
MLEKRNIVIKRRRREKRKNQAAFSLAAGLFLLGTTPFYVGNTFGQFHTQDDRAANVKACEVFPGHVQELMNDIKHQVTQMNALWQTLPAVTLQMETLPSSGKDVNSADQLRHLANDMNNQLRSLRDSKTERKRDIKETESISRELVEESRNLYTLFSHLQETTDIDAIYCLDNDGDYNIQKIETGIAELQLHHQNITRLLEYFNNIDQETLLPENIDNILPHFEKQITKQTSQRTETITQDISRIDRKIDHVKQERQAALEAAERIEQKEKERQEKLEKEKEEAKKEDPSESGKEENNKESGKPNAGGNDDNADSDEPSSESGEDSPGSGNDSAPDDDSGSGDQDSSDETGDNETPAES